MHDKVKSLLFLGIAIFEPSNTLHSIQSHIIFIIYMHVKSFAYIPVAFDIRFQGRIKKYFFKAIRTSNCY